MKAPIKWLKDYVDIDVTPNELARLLINCGFEVEEIIYKGQNIDKVVTCQILNIDKHPNADKLSVCKIDAGSFGKTQIVTNAKNIKLLDIVPVALAGSTLPSGKIEEGELRGVKSYGMFCSVSEFNITESDFEGAETDGILILPKSTKLGLDIKNVLNLNEYILDISVTANRPDCHCIIGIAREVAAVLNKPLKMPESSYSEKDGNISDYLKVEVKAPELCGRYMAKILKNIKIEKSDEFIRSRLALCGIRPINNIVDITNFLLLEMGQPMHAFDYKAIEDKTIVVRRAKKSEKIVTLDKKESELSDNMLVIADNKKPCALAGIMGGINSGIENDTKAVVLECAKFARDSIRKTSKALNVRSDSSARYEKGLDSYNCEISLSRALHLIQKYDCGEIVKGTIDILSENTKPRTIETTTTAINNVLGIEVPAQKIVDILNSLYIKTTLNKDKLTCVIPQHREDIDDYPDLAEEIIRIYGYDKIEGRLMPTAKILQGGKTFREVLNDDIKNILCGQGFLEIVTYSFCNENVFDKLNLNEDDNLRKAIKIFNPLNEDTAIMRTTMVSSVLNIVGTNLKRKVKSGRLFESGRVYLPKELPLSKLPDEKKVLSIAVFGENEDFYTLKGAVESIFNLIHKPMNVKRENLSFMHPGACAGVYAGNTFVGYFGQVNPYVLLNFDIKQKVFYAELDFEILFENLNNSIKCGAISKFPEIDRDLAILVDEKTQWADILKTVQTKAGSILESVDLFDIYKGDKIDKGLISLAFSLKFVSYDKTLKVEEVNEIIDNILKELKAKFNAQLRS